MDGSVRQGQTPSAEAPSGHLSSAGAPAPAGHRRLAVLSRQLTASSPPSAPSVATYATATGSPSSYARVHGEPSRSPTVWTPVSIVAKHELVDVKYHKSEEGIAKVSSWHIGGRKREGDGPRPARLGCLQQRQKVWAHRWPSRAPCMRMYHAAACIRARPHAPIQLHAHLHSDVPACAPLCLGSTRLQIAINRPEKRNAFRPETVTELSMCFADARDDPAVGVIILTGVHMCGACGTHVWNVCDSGVH
eukprot:366245-Chlamydomonas_euryale.AAC.35